MERTLKNDDHMMTRVHTLIRHSDLKIPMMMYMHTLANKVKRDAIANVECVYAVAN